jgi:hypothetical protein
MDTSNIGLDNLPASRRNAPDADVKVIRGFGHGPSTHKQARQLAAPIKRHMVQEGQKEPPHRWSGPF